MARTFVTFILFFSPENKFFDWEIFEHASQWYVWTVGCNE